MKKREIRKEKNKHYCEECGATLSDYEYENYGDLCENCYEDLTK